MRSLHSNPACNYEYLICSIMQWAQANSTRFRMILFSSSEVPYGCGGRRACSRLCSGLLSSPHGGDPLLYRQPPAARPPPRSRRANHRSEENAVRGLIGTGIIYSTPRVWCVGRDDQSRRPLLCSKGRAGGGPSAACSHGDSGKGDLLRRHEAGAKTQLHPVSPATAAA